MTLQQINALRDLSYTELSDLAIQHELIDRPAWREWSADRLRLKLIDAIVDKELCKQHVDKVMGGGRT